MACVSSSNMASTSSSLTTAGGRTPFGSPPPKLDQSAANRNRNVMVEKSQVGTFVKDTTKQMLVEDTENVPTLAVAKREAPRSLTESMKSPITTCFERMLGAAQVIAQQEDVVIDSNKVKNVNFATESNHLGSTALAPATKCSISTALASSPSENNRGVHQPICSRACEGSKTIESSPKRAKHTDRRSDPFQRIEANKALYRQVVLAMALQKNAEKEKGANSNSDHEEEEEEHVNSSQPPSLIINDGFFWKDYPPCEHILYEAMPTYYELSTQARQSKHQQKFNNDLVKKIRAKAEEQGLSFSPTFTDKKLRDRIRCFFKTHLQNAKKRLCTMQKRCQLAEHQAALRAMLETIEGPDSHVPSLTGSNHTKDEEYFPLLSE